MNALGLGERGCLFGGIQARRLIVGELVRTFFQARGVGKKVRRLIGTYAILGEGGKVVTVGHRYRRIRRR